MQACHSFGQTGGVCKLISPYVRRATAVAARYLGFDCHLILRSPRALADSDPGLAGNLLVERLAGAVIHQVWSLPAQIVDT